MINTHRNLCDSLAAHCTKAGDRVYVELRPAAWQTQPTGIPDVLAMGRFAYGPTTWKLVAYEVKVKKTDFQRDVKAGKWLRYVTELGVQRVMFAAPKGLVAPDEVPPEAGLIVFDDVKDTWRVARTGRVLQNDIQKVSKNLLLAMLDNAPQRDLGPLEKWGRLQSIYSSIRESLRELPDEHFRSFANAIGHEFATRASDKRRNEEEVSQVNEWAEKLIQMVAECTGETAENVRCWAGRGYSTPIIDLIERAQRAIGRMEEIHNVAALLETLTDCRYPEGWNLNNHREQAAPIIERESRKAS